MPPERPSIFTTSDLPKQSSKCPVGSHFSELTVSCRVKGARVEWSGGKLSFVTTKSHIKTDLAVKWIGFC